jgi:hypothetical protein
VAKAITVLKNALEHRRNKALTPYKPDMWHLLLTKFLLLDKYLFIPHGLEHGFDAGIPPIYTTYIPHNNPSLFVHTQQYQQIINREFESGRYLGPIPRNKVEALLGPFQTSPLSLVPKAGKPGNCRAVHNFSFPHNPCDGFPSINQSINSHLFPCTWGTFGTLCMLPHIVTDSSMHFPELSRANTFTGP